MLGESSLRPADVRRFTALQDDAWQAGLSAYASGMCVPPRVGDGTRSARKRSTRAQLAHVPLVWSRALSVLLLDR